MLDDPQLKLFETTPRVGRNVDSIGNYLSRLGIFGEDPGMVGRPNRDTRLSAIELDSLYLQNDLARRIVDELVEDALQNGAEITDAETNDPVEVPEELDLYVDMADAAKAGRLWGGGLMLVITADGSLSTPLDPENAPEILNFIVFDRWEATPVSYVEDPTSRYFAEPEFYQLSPATMGHSPQYPAVHHTRLLRFGGAKLPRRLRIENNSYDDSVLQSVWDTLRRFTETEQAIATTVQRFELATISIAGLAEAMAVDDGEDLIGRRMKLLDQSLNYLQAALIDADAGETYSRQYATVTGLDSIWDRLAHSVAKAAVYPMTKLFGMSPSGLSSDDESGRANWRSHVATYRNTELRPALKFLGQILNNGRPVKVSFPPLDESTAVEEAEIDKLNAETDAIRLKSRVMTKLEARIGLKKRGRLVESTEGEELPEELEDPDPVVAVAPPQPGEEPEDEPGEPDEVV